MQNAFLGKFKKFNASNFKVGIVAAQFNTATSDQLVKAALKKLAEYGVNKQNIVIKKVSGCVEVPLILKTLAESGQYDCLVAIGTIIRGDTPHFDFVCKMIADGILRVTLDFNIPIGFGVLTLENVSQAKKRHEVGGWAAEAALQSSKVIKEIRQ